MPRWLEFLGWVSGVVVAIGIVWTKLLRPIARLIVLHEMVLPLLTEMAEQFKGIPGIFKTLGEIADEFKPNKGTSMHDQITRVEQSLRMLEGKAKTMEDRDEEDRTKAARIENRVNDLAAKLDTQIEQASGRTKAISDLAAKVDEALPTTEK